MSFKAKETGTSRATTFGQNILVNTFPSIVKFHQIKEYSLFQKIGVFVVVVKRVLWKGVEGAFCSKHGLGRMVVIGLIHLHVGKDPAVIDRP